MTTLTRAITDTITMAKRNLRKSLNSPDKLVENVMAPVCTLLIFVYVLGGAMQGTMQGISYVNYIVPGIFLLCIGECSTTTAISVSMDMEKGIIDRFRSMPIAQSSVLTGRVLEAVFRSMLTLALIIAVAFMTGFRANAGVMAWLGVLGLCFLFSLTITWIAVLFGLLVKHAENASVFAMFIMLFSYLSSGFIPTSTLPTILRVFAENQPMTPMIEAVRALLLGLPLEQNHLWAILWCVGLLAVAYLLAIQIYKRKLNK